MVEWLVFAPVKVNKSEGLDEKPNSFTTSLTGIVVPTLQDVYFNSFFPSVNITV